MSRWAALLFGHIVLLILASTAFTAVTGLYDHHFNWQYFSYSRRSGWGQLYHSDYSAPVVLAYLAAYGTGFVVYLHLWRMRWWIIGGAGAVLCAIGFASFAYELTHWFTEFYGSWIASFPGGLLALAVVALVLQFRREAGQQATSAKGAA